MKKQQKGEREKERKKERKKETNATFGLRPTHHFRRQPTPPNQPTDHPTI